MGRPKVDNVTVSWRVSREFQEWMLAEQFNRGMTTRGFMDNLAEIYIADRVNKGLKCLPWPEAKPGDGDGLL